MEVGAGCNPDVLDRSWAIHVHHRRSAVRRHFDKRTNLPASAQVRCSRGEGEVRVFRIGEPHPAFALLSRRILRGDHAALHMGVRMVIDPRPPVFREESCCACIVSVAFRPSWQTLAEVVVSTTCVGVEVLLVFWR